MKDLSVVKYLGLREGNYHIAKHKHLLEPSIVAHICHNFQRLSHNN